MFQANWSRGKGQCPGVEKWGNLGMTFQGSSGKLTKNLGNLWLEIWETGPETRKTLRENPRILIIIIIYM